MNKKAIIKNMNDVFHILSQEMPNPRVELDYINPYTLLVAVVLSARATDISVNKATKSLFKVATTPMEMISLGLEGLMSHVKTIGLYQNKSKNIISLSHQLIENYNSEVPNSMEELVKLAGVGRKSASVILCEIFKEIAMPVDTHVNRVSNRLGWVNSNNPDIIERELLSLLPKQYAYQAHNYLVLHGRYTCKSQKPKCDECKVNNLCRTFSNNKKK
jgi:endonuclease-3